MFVTGWDAETYASKLAANEVLMGYSNHEGSFYPRAVINKCIATLEQYDLKYDLAAQNKLSTPCEEYRLQTCVYMQSHATWARHFSSGCTPPPTKVRRYPKTKVLELLQWRVFVLAAPCYTVCSRVCGCRWCQQPAHHAPISTSHRRASWDGSRAASVRCGGPNPL